MNHGPSGGLAFTATVLADVFTSSCRLLSSEKTHASRVHPAPVHAVRDAVIVAFWERWSGENVALVGEPDAHLFRVDA